nr:MAG: ORF3 [Torque teno polar bear virus 12]
MTQAMSTRSRSTRGTSSRQGYIPICASNDSYKTYILNSLQKTEPWSSPTSRENPKANSGESKTSHRPPQAATIPGAVGETPPPVRRAKRRKVRHYRDRTRDSTESDTDGSGDSWESSDTESSCDF